MAAKICNFAHNPNDWTLTWDNGTTATAAVALDWAAYTTNTITKWQAVNFSQVWHQPAYGEVPFGILSLSCGVDYKLPDASILKIDNRGNYVIEDKDAKVTYRANNDRAFNKYINASDIAEEFIKMAAGLGVRRQALLDLPFHLFTKFLALQAAAADGEESPVSREELTRHPALQSGRRLIPRCLACGRFIQKQLAAVGVQACSEMHALAYHRRQMALVKGVA